MSMVICEHGQEKFSCPICKAIEEQGAVLRGPDNAKIHHQINIAGVPADESGNHHAVMSPDQYMDMLSDGQKIFMGIEARLNRKPRESYLDRRIRERFTSWRPPQ